MGAIDRTSIANKVYELAREKEAASSTTLSGSVRDRVNQLYQMKKQGVDYKAMLKQQAGSRQRRADAQAKQQEMAGFYDRYNALLDSYNETYAGGQQWQSESQRQAWENTLSDYRTEAASWESWVKQNADIYGSDASQGFDAMWNQLGEMQSGVKRAGEVYGQYGSEEEYKEGLKQAERRKAYSGMTTQELQSKINRLEGDDFRIEYDRAVQEDADAQRQLKDAQLSGAPQSVINEYQAAADAAAARVKALEEEQTTYQTDAQWLKDYAPMADYYHGVDQYGYSLAEMKPYEILDITPQSEGEQAWIEDYVENVAAQGGYIGVEDWTQAAEAQRAYDELTGRVDKETLSILTDAASYYNDDYSNADLAYQAVREAAEKTGWSFDETETVIRSISPYVAMENNEAYRAKVAEYAKSSPILSTALTYVVQPLAGVQANTYLLGGELTGQTVSAANPMLRGYTYTSGTRGQVGEDIAANYGSGAKWVYDAVNSTVDSAVNMLLTRGAVGMYGGALSEKGVKLAGATISNLVMGSGASAQRFIELKQEGYDDFQAVAGAAGAGLVEGLTEWYGADKLFEGLEKYGSAFLKMLAQGLSEGAEERASNELNGLIDWIFYDSDNAESIVRKIVGWFGGYKAAGYDSNEAMRLAFSEATKENWSAFFAGMFSGSLHQGVVSAGQGISRAAETYSYAKDVKADSGKMAAVNALVEKQKVNAPKLTAGDNIVRVMKTVKAAANEANYNSTKEALRQTGLMLREEMTKNGSEVSDSLIAAINKTTVAESISKVRELSRDEARLLSLTKAEQRELNSKSARAVVDSLKQVAEGSESFSDKMHRMAADYAYGFADELKKVHGEATGAALKEISDTFMSGETSITEKPKLDKILEAHPAANKAVVTKAYEAASDFNKEITVNDEGALELEGASPAAVAVMNAQYSGIKDEDGRADFSVGAKAAYYTGVYYAGTNYGKALMDEIYAEYGDIKDELRAVYEQGAKEKEAAAQVVEEGGRIATSPAAPRNDMQVSGSDTQEGQTPQRKRGGVRNISAQEAEAAGVSTVDTSKLTKRQKTEGKILRSLAKQMGFDVVFFDSMRADGTQAGANGWYTNGTIYIDVNAGYVNDTSMLRTTAHELTHFIQQYNKEAYSKLRDFIVDRYYEADRKAFEAEVRRIIDAQGLSEGAAIDEVVADGCQMMLRDSAAPQMLYEHDAKLYEKVSAWVREWVNKLSEALKKALADVAPNSATARALSQTADTMTELQKLWDEALVGAVENKAKSPAVNSEAVQYELREYSPRQKQNWESSKRIVVYKNAAHLMEFIDTAINDAQFNKKMYFGTIAADLSKAIKNKTGVDVENYNLSLGAYEIRKIIKDHGNAAKEQLRGQRAISREDFAHIVDVVLNPSSISLSSKDYMGKPVIEFTGNFNGRMNVAAVVSDKRLDLFVQTIYVNVKKGDLATPTGEQAPANTPEANDGTISFDEIIADQDGQVKQYSMRDPAQMAEDAVVSAEAAANMSNREILANAMETAAQTDLERQKIADYRKKIGLLNEQEQKLERLKSELADAQGDRAKDLRDEIKRTENRINTHDGQLLRLEAARPLQDVLDREKAALNKKLEEAKAWRKEWRERAATAKAEGSQRLREYRTKRNESDAVKKYRGRVESNVKALIDLMVTNTDKKHVPEALKEPIAQFIEALDLTSKQAREGGELTLKDKDYAQRLNALRAAVATYQANAATGEAEGYLDLPDGFFEMLNTNFDTPVYEMGAAELRLLDRALTILKTAISQSNRLMVNKNYARVSEAAEDTIKDLDGLGAAKDLGWLKGINKLFLWNNATPYYAFRRLGPAGETVFESLQSGWDKLALNAQKVVQDSEKIYTTQEVREWGKDVLEIELSGERKVQMTAAQAMSVYCLAKRQQGLGHLLGGGIKISAIDLGKGKQIVQYDNHTLSIEDLQAITGALTERQIQVADKLQDYMGSVGAEWGNEVSMARFGYKAFGEANYFPITSDPNNLNSLNTDAKSSDMFRLLNLSATKSLVKGANNAVVISNVFDVFAAHMADMAKYNALALPILDMVKWYNYKQRTETGKGQIVTRTLQKSLEKTFGVDQGGKSYAAEYIKQFIKDLNGVSESGRDLGFISTFMGRYKKAAVAANLRVAVQQPMSYARALAVMDAKYLAKGIAGNVGEAVREMRQHSGIAAWKNMGFFDTNIGRDLTEQIKHDETLGDRISDASMILSEKADEVTWGTLWKACKAEMADKGHSGNELLEKTAERFRQVVYATQVVDATTTRSHLMRSNSPINKMWTAFMSEPTLTYNMMLDSVLQWHYEKRRGNEKPWCTVGKQIKKAVGAYFVNAVLLAMATAVLDAWRDDDDFETFWEKYTDALGGNILDELNPVTKIVVLKDMWDILVEGGSSDRMDTAFLTQTKKAYDVVAEMFNVTFRGADPTATTYYGKMGDYGVAYEVFKAIGGLSGMPFAPASREVASLWNNTVGRLYPNLKWKTYNEKPTAGYEKLYEAMVDGDQDEQRSIIDQLHGKGYDDEAITDGVKAVIKGLYLGGDLSDEEAGDQLVAFCGYSATATGSKGVNYQLDKWSIEDFKMAADMEAAFAAGDGAAAKAAVQEQMKRYGRTESQIRGDITSYFKEDYVNGDTADRQRIRSLMLATGLYKAEDLDKQLAGWLKDAE